MFFILDSVERKKAALDYIYALAGYPTMCVEVKEYKKNRSVSQNRLYWKWLGIIAKDTTGDADDLHEQLKVRFLGVEHKVINGVALILPKSTSALSTKEFTEYLVKIEALAVTLNISLPHPDDYHLAMGTKGRWEDEAA